jgi:hypothetical protein
MKCALIVLVVLLLVPSAADARRGKRVLVIRDYTSAAWDGVIEQTVEDFNAVMPQGGPQLVYERRETAPCDVRAKQRRRASIKVCSVPERPYGGRERGQMILLNDTYTGPWYDQFRAGVVCHEMMHALTGIPDNYGALPDQSCVWGELSQPGPLDVDRLREMYQRKRHRAPPRRRVCCAVPR